MFILVYTHHSAVKASCKLWLPCMQASQQKTEAISILTKTIPLLTSCCTIHMQTNRKPAGIWHISFTLRILRTFKIDIWFPSHAPHAQLLKTFYFFKQACTKGDRAAADANLHKKTWPLKKWCSSCCNLSILFRMHLAKCGHLAFKNARKRRRPSDCDPNRGISFSEDKQSHRITLHANLHLYASNRT